MKGISPKTNGIRAPTEFSGTLRATHWLTHRFSIDMQQSNPPAAGGSQPLADDTCKPMWFTMICIHMIPQFPVHRQGGIDMRQGSKVLQTAFPFETVEPEAVHILRDIRRRPAYDKNGNRTEGTAGYAYDVVNTASFNQYDVVVDQTTPLMEPKELLNLREQGERVLVTFQNARIRAYFSTRSNSYEDSVRADGVSLVEESLI